MTLANVLIGLGIGFPMMIALGPISVLLLDQGLERGMRAAAPAAFGVASADLTLSVVSAAAGSAVVAVLAPWRSALTLVAVAVLVVLAVQLGRAALSELRQARRPASTVLELAGVGAGSGAGAPAGLPHESIEARGTTFASLGGGRLAAAFYGLTMVNPLTVVLFASVVIAGGPGVGTAGWALGMATASLLAHGGFVVLGGILGARLSPTASGALRLGAALFMGALAVHFALGA